MIFPIKQSMRTGATGSNAPVHYKKTSYVMKEKVSQAN